MTSNIIKFTTSDKEAIEYFPPIPASKMIPDWYKDTPVEVDEVKPYTDPHTPTVKRCVPVLDYLTTGYIIRATYEVQIKQLIDDKFFNDFDFRCRHTDQYLGKHPWYQAQVKIENKKNHYLKLNQPWHIETPPGYSCMFFQPHYFFNENYSIFPGVVDTDKHSEPVGLVGLVHKKEFTINPGDPLVVVFPFKRNDWESNIEFRDNEWQKSGYKYRLKNFWSGIYADLVHSKKNYR